MASTQYPLQVPEELLDEIRKAAQEAGISMADAMRATMKMGLPKFREQFRTAGATKPFTRSEAARAFGPDSEWDPLEKALAGRSKRQPEED